MADRGSALAPASRRGRRAAAPKRTDTRDHERAMLPVLIAIEARWLQAEADYQAELPRLREQWEHGIDPDLELAVLAAGGKITYLGLDGPDETGD